MIGIFAVSFMRAAGIVRAAETGQTLKALSKQDRDLLERLRSARRDRPVDWVQRQRLEALQVQHRAAGADQAPICDSSAVCRAV